MIRNFTGEALGPTALAASVGTQTPSAIGVYFAQVARRFRASVKFANTRARNFDKRSGRAQRLSNLSRRSEVGLLPKESWKAMNCNEPAAHCALALGSVKGKGILAADESTATLKRRFDGIRLESTEEARRTYREMLLTAPGVAETLSGVILYDETIRQKTNDGVPFPEHLTKLGVIPGDHQVDTGAQANCCRIPARGRSPKGSMDCGNGWSSITSSVPASQNGARSSRSPTKFLRGSRWMRTRMHWRATPRSVEENAVVPIIEPEVFMDGAHSIGRRCEQVTEEVLQEAVF